MNPSVTIYTFEELIVIFLRTIKYILSKWFFIGIISISCGLLGIFAAWIATPNYVAVSTFVAETGGNDKLGGYGSIAAQFGIDLGQSGGGAFEGESLLDVFKSRNIVVKTLLSPSEDKDSSRLLIEDYLDNRNMRKGWEMKPELKKIDFTDKSFYRQKDSVLTKVYESIIKSKLKVEKKDKKLNLMTLEMNDKNEIFSKRFTELLLANTVNFYTEYKTKKAKQNVDILQYNADSLKSILLGSIKEVATLNDLNLNPVRQIVRVRTQEKGVNLSVSQALFTEILKQLEIAKITLRKEMPLVQIIDNPILPLKKTNLGRFAGGIIGGSLGLILSIIYFLVRRWAKTFNKNLMLNNSRSSA